MSQGLEQAPRQSSAMQGHIRVCACSPICMLAPRRSSAQISPDSCKRVAPALLAAGVELVRHRAGGKAVLPHAKHAAALARLDCEFGDELRLEWQRAGFREVVPVVEHNSTRWLKSGNAGLRDVIGIVLV